MRYVQIGTKVLYKQQKAEVIEQYQENDVSYVVLATTEGPRSVPATKIIWTGKTYALTPEGHQIAQALYTVEHAIAGIHEQLQEWDTTYPDADLRDRKLAIKYWAFAAIETATAATGNNDKQLGLIVRRIVERLENI